MLADKIRYYQKKKMLKIRRPDIKEYPWLRGRFSLRYERTVKSGRGFSGNFSGNWEWIYYKSKNIRVKLYTTNMVNGNIWSAGQALVNCQRCR